MGILRKPRDGHQIHGGIVNDTIPQSIQVRQPRGRLRNINKNVASLTGSLGISIFMNNLRKRNPNLHRDTATARIQSRNIIKSIASYLGPIQERMPCKGLIGVHSLEPTDHSLPHCIEECLISC